MLKVLLFAMPDHILGFDMVAQAPNLAIVSLAGNVDPGICDVKVADLLLIRRRMDEYVLGLLREHSPALVGLSCMSFQYASAIKLAKLVKSHDKKIHVVIGGYHPTLMYEDISASPESQFIDFIVRGEGEATFNELVAAMNAGSGYERIAGLSYKANGTFHHNPPRGLLPLEDIQLPKRDARLITEGFHSFGLPMDAIETSRGCTHNCKFCSINHMYGRSFRGYEMDRIIADIRNVRRHGAKIVAMADDNITLDLKRLEVICEEIISAKLNNLHYALQASVSGIAHSKKLVQKMADAGVKLVFLGIESASKTSLDFLGKKTSTPEATRRAVGYLRDNGIICAGGFIVGNPDDDKEAMWEAFKLAWELKIDIPLFFILTPHARTRLRDELLAENLVTNPDDFSTYHGFAANVKTKHLSSEEIDRIVERMYNAYHTNLTYLKFMQVRTIYPVYFWKRLVTGFTSAILDLARKG